MRLSYTLENNLLLSTNDTVEEYLQYGKKAAAPHMFTSNVAVLLHGGNAFGVAIGATLHPNFLRNDIRYTYEFMDQYKRTFRDSYMITISMWGDFAFKPRKRI
jgi:hypothetical protein